MTVQTLRARLTRDDIQRLSSATDSEGRALAARKFCARFASVDLSDDERAIGAEVAEALCLRGDTVLLASPSARKCHPWPVKCNATQRLGVRDVRPIAISMQA